MKKQKRTIKRGNGRRKGRENREAAERLQKRKRQKKGTVRGRRMKKCGDRKETKPEGAEETKEREQEIKMKGI